MRCFFEDGAVVVTELAGESPDPGRDKAGGPQPTGGGEGTRCTATGWGDRRHCACWRCRVPVAPAPLTAAELERLVSDIPAQRRDLIVRASLGNPFYAQAPSRLTYDALLGLVDEHPPVHGGQAVPGADRSAADATSRVNRPLFRPST
jgi:hypothetical protein